MNFPVRIALPVSHRFWIIVPSFSLVSRYLLISSLISLLTHSLFNTCYLASICLHVFSILLWLISSFIVLWSEKMLDMIAIFLNILRLVWFPNIWSILENIPCALDKYVYSAVWGYREIHTLWLPLLGLGVHRKDQAVHQDKLLPAPGLGASQQKPQGTLRSTSPCLCLLAVC